MFSKKAQGTIEYLIIISVVIVVSLIVVGITTGILNNNIDSTNQTNLKLAWLTKEISVIDAVAASDGTASFVLKSNMGEFITINSLEIDENTPFALEEGAGKAMAPGQVYTAQVSGVAPCTGQGKIYKIKINYTSLAGLSKSIPQGDFLASCSSDSLSIPSLLFVGTPTLGTIPISNAEGGYVNSGTAVTGLLILNNAMCFGGATCDANIKITGSDLVLSSK